MNNITIGFIGFGLIGGSIAKALKSLNTNYNLIAYHYNKNKVNPNLEQAISESIIDHVYTSIDDFCECDMIFLCAPVLMNIEYLEYLKPIIKPTCILTDVGSVKGCIHEAVINLNLEANFIGGHPMAGSEKVGYAHSNEKLLENAYYIITPTSQTKQNDLDFYYNLIKNIGALPLILDYNEHDNITAAISHVPHIIASSLVNLVKYTDDESEKMRLLAAGGFKDITRIASSSPIMWQNICLTNSKSIQDFLDRYIRSLEEISLSLAKGDEQYLYDIFNSASEYRDLIPNKSVGMIYKTFEVFLDIIDESGAIATIATILASNNISIKNIGIIHNREFQDGVLRIEFYEELARTKAIELLKKYSYNIYQR